MCYEGEALRVPAEGTNSELNDGELLSGVLDFEIKDVGAVRIERLPPRRARQAGHLQVDGYEVGSSDMALQLR